MIKAAALFSRFLYVESCGQCPPCKFSSGEITEHLNRLVEGKGTRQDIETIIARCGTVDQGNRCALPTGERLVIESLVNRFSDEFQSHCKSACSLTRELKLPKLVDYDEQKHVFTYDERQRLKQPDWSYVKTNSFA
jgi:NADH-quinone oxidoreductase subunit F